MALGFRCQGRGDCTKILENLSLIIGSIWTYDFLDLTF